MQKLAIALFWMFFSLRAQADPSVVPVLSDSALLPLQEKHFEKVGDKLDDFGLDEFYDREAPSHPELMLRLFGDSVHYASLDGLVYSLMRKKSLQGADVVLKSLDRVLSTRSDANGIFHFRGAEPGLWLLRIWNNGHAAFEIEVELKAGQNPIMEVRLDRHIAQGKSMKVSRPQKKGSSAAMLDKRRKAGGLVEGMGAEQISRSTDSDAAALAKRISGTAVVGGKFVFVRGLSERYTNMTLNGLPVPSPEKGKRIVPQDLFPASSLESFSIYKSLQPSLEADFAGASIALVTKGIPEKGFWKFSLGGSTVEYSGDGSFTIVGAERMSYDGGFDYFGFDDGTRQIPDGVPRSIPKFDEERVGDILDSSRVAYTRKERAWYASRFNNQLGVDRSSVWPGQDMGLSFGRVWKTKAGNRAGGMVVLNFKNKYKQSENRKLKTAPGALRLERTIWNEILQDSVESLVMMEDSAGFPLFVETPSILQSISTGSYSTNLTAMIGGGWESRNHELWIKSLFVNISKDRASRILSRELEGATTFQQQKNEERYLLEFERRHILVGQLGGGHYIGRGLLDSMSWAVGLAQTAAEVPDSRKYRYSTQDSTLLEIDGDTIIDGVPRFPDERVLVASRQLDYRNLAQWGTRTFEELGEFAHSFRQDNHLIIPPSLSRRDTFWSEGKIFSHWTLPTLDLGFSGKNAKRKFRVTRYSWLDRAVESDPTGNRDFIEELREPQRVYDRITGKDQISDFITAPQDYDAYSYSEGSATGYFELRNGMDILGRRFGLRTGLRRELYRLHLRAPFTNALVFENPSLAHDSAVNLQRKEWSWYPVLFLSQELWCGISVKGIWSNTKIRPIITELAPFSRYDFDASISQVGNPSLKSTEVVNWDLRFDWFMPGNKLLSLSLFHKDFDAPIEPVIATDATRMTVINADRAYAQGLEVEGDFDFDGALQSMFGRSVWTSGWSLYMNAAWIESRVFIDSNLVAAGIHAADLSSKVRPMVGQSPWLFNTRLTHEKKGALGMWINGLFFNHAGERLKTVGVDRGADVWEQGFPSLDYLLKWSTSRHGISFKLVNLLNSARCDVKYEKNQKLDYVGISSEERNEVYEGVARKHVISETFPGLGISLKYSMTL